ncbi:leucine-rich repeat domain-containing protein, partial [Candidatus Micrarchaeota archaeon]|nr:leucine-rich repeat domain-containing protein [Candidatus Micrarchaeota archaeon]
TLILGNNQISDISALSTLTNLQQLYLNNNQISDISALSTLTNLNYLDLNNNQISNISTLSTLSNLNWLYLRDNQISTNPLCPASAEQNATYETLEGYGCSINWDSQSEAICDDACDNDEDGLVDCDDSDCDEDEACEEECTPISIPDSGLLNAVCSALGEDPGCTVTDCDALTLTELWAKDREISDLTGIEYFTNLNTLILGNNQISNISALSTLSNLNFLYLYSNQISDISALSTLTNLQGLSLWDNQISDISALSTLTNLNTLELGGNKISDISALSGLSNLTKLYLGSNQISINPECPASAVQLSIKAVLEVLGCYVDWSSQSEAICDDGCDNDEDRLVDCDDSDCDEDKAPLECAFTALCPDCEVCAGEPMGCDKFGATPEECNVQLGCELVQESVCILGVDCGSYGEESACTKGGCCDWVDVKGQWQCTQNFDCSIYQNGQQCSGNPCCLWTLGSPVCSGTPVACEDRAKEECILGCLVGGYTDDESVTCYSDNECSVSCEVEEEVVCEDNSVCKIVACDSGENCDEFIFEDACGNGTCSDEEYDITMYCGVNTNRLQCSEYAINNLIYAHGDGVCVLLYHNQVGMNSNEFLNYCDFIGGEREIPKEGESLTATICDCETEELVCDGYRICNAGQGPNEQFCGSGTCGGIEYEVNSYCQLFVDSLEECAEAVLNPNVMTAYPYYSDGNCMIANYEGSGADESQFQQDCALMGATTSPVPLSATMTACDCSVDCSDPANIDKLECCFDPTDNSTFYNRVSVVNNILYLIQSVRLCEGDFYLPAHDDWYYNSYGQPTPPNGEGFAIIMSAEDVILYGPQSGPAVMRGNNTGVGIWMHGSNNIIDGNNNLIIQDYSTAILAESIISNPFEYNIKNLIINDVAKGIHIRPNLLLMQQSQVTYGNIQNVNIDGTCGTGIKFEQASFNNELFGLTKGTIENCEMECNQPYTGFNADVRNVILIAKDSLEVLNGNDALMTTKRKDENVGIEGNLQYNSVNIKIDPAQKAQYEQGKILKFEEPVDFIRGDSGNSLSIKEKETGVYGIAWKSDLINISKNLPMNAVNFDNKFISLDSQEILEYIEEKTIEVTLELTSDMECSKAIVYKSSSHVENREAILTDINKEAVIRNGQSTVDYITVTSCVDPVLFDPQGNDIINGYIVFEVMNGQWSSYTVAQEGVPEIISIEITPQEPTKDDDLVCTAIAVSDEVDELNVTFTWTEEGAPFSISENTISCESGEECTDTLSSDETYSDQVWTCTVIAFDGEEYSSEESDTVTIHMGELPDEICDDGIDNDGDGLVDCEDPDCDNETCDIGKVCINYECISPTSPSRPSPTPSNPNLEIDTIGEYCVGEEITFIITDEYSDLISTAKIEESKVKLGTLGYTNSIGEFRYIFENTGNYRIDVYKSRYNPAYQYISVSDCTGYCTSNNDCLTGYYCDGTQCVELECLPGFTVSGHSCVAPKECQTDSNCKHDQYCSDEGYCEIVECDCGYIADHQCNEYECCSDIDCKVPIELCVNNVCTPVSDDIIEQTEGSKEDSAIERFEKKLLNIKSKLGELYILIEEAKITGQNIDEMQELLEQARAYVLQGDFENAELTIQKAKFQVEGEDKDTRIVYLALLIIVLLISMMVWHNKTKAANHIKTKNTKKKTRKKR